MTDRSLYDHLANAWIKATHAAIRESWRPAGFDPKTGTIGVECRNHAYLVLLKAAGPNLIRRMNAALPEPLVKAVSANLWQVRVLVTGSRTWADRQAIADALLDAWHDATQTISPDVRFIVVHGDCPQGADRIAKQWAMDNGLAHEPHPADWSAPCTDACSPNASHRKTSRRHGDYCPMAGHNRNQRMVDRGADLVLAFHRNNSSGTADCIRRARRAGIPVHIVEDHSA
ncbi:DUF2493 domain-containing protein [Streptomyces sp. NPDC093269]|uniref:DUF2493 domain-containing protein n=1 Tax=Streptomyces sp. NPDC093269 TaxID=3366038 RepID=UPI00382D2177